MLVPLYFIFNLTAISYISFYYVGQIVLFLCSNSAKVFHLTHNIWQSLYNKWQYLQGPMRWDSPVIS